MEREALKLAEIIEHFDSNDESLPLELLKEIAATLRALAQPVQEPPSEWAGIKAILDEYGLQAIDFVADFKAALAQPPQRPWVGLSDADIAEVVDTTCQYSGGYEEFLIKKAERKSRSMNT